MPKVVMVLLVILLGLVIYYYVLPHRSVEAYCRVYKTESLNLYQRYKGQAEKNESKDSVSALLGSMAVLAGAPNDMAIFMDKLAKVAPKEIEPDLITLRDNWKKSEDIPVGGNMMQALASGIMLSLQSKGAEDRVNEYTEINCHVKEWLEQNNF